MHEGNNTIPGCRRSD